MKSDAIAVLLDTAARRRHRSFLLLVFFLTAVILGSASLSTSSPGAGLWLAGLLLLLYPALLAFQDAAAVGTLRHGRGLEEVLNTLTTPLEWIDSTAAHTVRSVERPAGWLSLLVAEGVLAYQVCGPGGVNWHLFLLPAGFYLACLATASVSAYFFLMCATCDSQGTYWFEVQPVLWALLLGLSGFTSALAFLSSPYPGLALLGLTVYFLGRLNRYLAVRGVECSPIDFQEHETAVAAARPRNRFVRPFNQNPIVVREFSRLARRVEGGWIGFAMQQHGLLLMGLPLLWFFCFLPMSATGVTADAAWQALALSLWLALPLLALLQPVMAAASVSSAMVEERERRTLESLALTQVTAEEFLDGWAALGWHRQTLEFLVLLALTLVCIPVLGTSWTVVFTGYLFACLYCVACTYLGVLVSVKARSRGHAGSSAIAWVVLLDLVLGYAWFSADGWRFLLLPVLAGLLAAWARTRSLALLRH
ncbi:MAG: hypothetical protein AB1758_01155 [Candidatus Eremiobacterota bacterium]